MGDDLRITAGDLIAAITPAVAIDTDDDNYDFVVDALTNAAANITAALQVLLDSQVDDEQSVIL